jgi:hypothetical protein
MVRVIPWVSHLLLRTAQITLVGLPLLLLRVKPKARLLVLPPIRQTSPLIPQRIHNKEFQMAEPKGSSGMSEGDMMYEPDNHSVREWPGSVMGFDPTGGTKAQPANVDYARKATVFHSGQTSVAEKPAEKIAK